MFFGLLFSGPVGLSDAEKTALNLVIERDNSGQIESIKNILIDEKDGTLFFYIVDFEPSGFALISGDDRITPILGYSFINDFTPDNLPLQLEDFLDNVRAYIQYVIEQNISASESITLMWENYLGDSFSLDRDLRSVNPLITANWNQGGAWNDMCPEDSDGPGGNVYAGCVAISMVQIMYYWGYPEVGYGSHGYTPWGGYGYQFADFENSYYDYNDMPNTYATTESQELLYHHLEMPLW